MRRKQKSSSAHRILLLRAFWYMVALVTINTLIIGFGSGYTRLATSPVVTVSPGPPVISALSPAGAPVGGPAFTLTVDGSGFTSGSIVRWNGANRATTFVSATQVRASIPASDLTAVGTAQITVFDPGKGTSSARPFAIQGVVIGPILIRPAAMSR